MREWFEDESFWIDFYPLIFPEESFVEAEKEIYQVLNLIKFQGATVLDLCCGPGRHSMALAARGLRVTGVDRTKFLLNKAKAAASSRKLEIEWVREDMREFLRPGHFDLVLNLFTSFGYFQEKEDDRKVLANIYANLKPGGVFFIDVVSKEWIARVFESTVSRETADGALVVQRHKVVDDWSRQKNEWILIKDGRARSYVFELNIYSGQELKERLQTAGFRKIQLYGNLRGGEYGLQAERLIAVSWK